MTSSSDLLKRRIEKLPKFMISDENVTASIGAYGDWLNAPWGVALAPLDFGRFSHDLLIGQFAGGGDTQSSGIYRRLRLGYRKI
jgi:hypothetical protein